MPEKSLSQYQITVSGKVQRVGFRDKVEDFAIDNNILGYVQNLPGQDVQIIAEGKITDLIRFCKAVENCELPVKVRKMLIVEKPYEGRFDLFLIKRGDPTEELGERFDHAIHYLHSIDTKQDRMLYNQDQMLGKQDQMLGKQDQMIDKQDQMLGKQDQMIDKQDQMLGKQDQMLGKQDQMIDKQDQMLGKQDQMIEAQKHTVDLQSKTLDEIHSLRKDFADRFMQEVSEARKEIRELRSELVQAGVLCDGSR
jgi:acylphosphatase